MMKHHAELIPLCKRLCSVPGCKLKRKFKDRSFEAVNKGMSVSS